jgi:hypothetical protein
VMAKSNRVQWRWAKRFDPGKFLFPFSARFAPAPGIHFMGVVHQNIAHS